MKRLTAEEKLARITEMDKAYWEKGIAIAGMDEAGRGPLAGPVVAACVVMPSEPLLLHINDSKKLTEARRESLYDQIMETAIFARAAFASVEEIEALNILGATRLCMERAAEGCPCDLFLLDAIEGVRLPREAKSIVSGDALSYSIAAASIIAKVTRDRAMRELDEQYPGYGFAKHKGYGTAEHIAALRERGKTEQHRALFIRKFV